MRSSTFGVLSLVGALAFALPVMAQDDNTPSQGDAGGRELGRVVKGNRTIVFEAADARNIDANRLQTWNDFAETHPRVAKELAYNNSMRNSSSYLAKNPPLDEFYRAHPDIKEAWKKIPATSWQFSPAPANSRSADALSGRWLKQLGQDLIGERFKCNVTQWGAD